MLFFFSVIMLFFFFKQKTAYEMRISDWSSDVCSSDLAELGAGVGRRSPAHQGLDLARGAGLEFHDPFAQARAAGLHGTLRRLKDPYLHGADCCGPFFVERSEEHTSDIPSLMRISSAVFFLQQNQLSLLNFFSSFTNN